MEGGGGSVGSVGHWVMEYILRCQDPLFPSDLIKKYLSITPLPVNDSKLKKMLLLRTLQDYLHDVSLPEKTLEIMELYEELLRRDAAPVTAAMRSAYCALALECTLRHLLVDLRAESPGYLGAVHRIWRARGPLMSGTGNGTGAVSRLVSPELERWRSEILDSVTDSTARERLASVDTRRDAIVKLRAYLKEAWADLGPSFIEIAAAKHLEAQRQQREIENGTAAAEEVNPSTAGEVQQVGECGSEELQKFAEDSLLNSLEKESRDADVTCLHVVVNNNEADLMKKDQASAPHDDDDHRPSLMERDNIGQDSAELQKLAEDSQLNSLQVNEAAPIEEQSRDADVPCPHDVINNNEADMMENDQSSAPQNDDGHRPSLMERDDIGQGSEELQKLAKLEVNKEAPIEEQSRDGDVTCPHAVNNNEADMMENDQTSAPHNDDDHMPSLMERNGTARVYEWDDSTDALDEERSDHANRFQLPSPKGKKHSPLVTYRPPSISKRRKLKRWSQLEEETLKTAVDKFGRGNWKIILDSHKDIFEERTEVDLKDKWRNMTK